MDLESQSKRPQRKPCCYITKTALIITVIALTFCFFLTEVVVGHLTKSNAIVADSFHIFGDLISLVIGLISVRMSKRQSSLKNTFGWARAEVLGASINAVFLLALCFTILLNSITSFFDPQPLEKIDLILGIGAGSLALNIVSMTLFAIRSCQEKSQNKEMNMNLKVVFLNALGDSLGSMAVIISGLLIKFVPPKDDATFKWKLYIDPVLSLIIAGIIAFNTIPLLKKSSWILLQSVPTNCDIEEIRNKIEKIKGVKAVRSIHIWSLNSEKTVASVHGK
jgi:zinc transporter 1